MNFGMALRESTYASDLFPRYYNLVDAGLVYGVTYTAAAATVASATATGSFALFNPAASGVQLVLLAANPGVTALTANAAGFGVGFQFVPGQQPTVTTNGNTPQNVLVGSSAVSAAKVYTAGTLVGAPTVPGYLSYDYLADLTTSDLVTPKDEVSGTVVVQPNSGICVVVTSTLAAPTLTPSLLWAEIPLG